VGRRFKDKEFAKKAAKSRITDETLNRAIDEADQGIVSAYLGGQVVKLRIARPGEGRRGGFRTIVAFRRHDRAFFIHLFAKNTVENIDENDLSNLKSYAELLFDLTEEQLDAAIKVGALVEISPGIK
jgi:hypothetical protein